MLSNVNFSAFTVFVLTVSFCRGNSSFYVILRKKIRTCDNSIVRSLSILSTYEYGKIMSKYFIHNPGSGAAQLKSSLWRYFVDTVF